MIKASPQQMVVGLEVVINVIGLHVLHVFLGPFRKEQVMRMKRLYKDAFIAGVY